jgi:hypothetical protein
MAKKTEKKFYPVDLTPGPGEPELELTETAAAEPFSEHKAKATAKPAPGYRRWMAAPGVTGIATHEGTWNVVNGYVDIPDGAYPEGLGVAYFYLPGEEA